MQGVSLAESLGDGGEQAVVLIVGVCIGRVLLNRILQCQHSRVISVLGVGHTYAVHILHREVDVLEDAFALATGAECCHRYSHAYKHCREYEDYYDCHLFRIDRIV